MKHFLRGTLLWLFLALGLAFEGRTETLAAADARYKAAQERIDFEALSREEALISGYRRKLETLKASYQKAGDLPNVLAVDDETKRLLASKRESGSPAPAATPLGRDMQTFAGGMAKSRAMRDEQTRKLTTSYAAYLDTRVKELTKAGNLEEARTFHVRAGEIRDLVPAAPAAPAVAEPAAPAVTPAVTPAARPGARPESASVRWRNLAKQAGLILRVGNLGKDKDLRDLDAEEAPDGFLITTPKNPGSYHKLLFAGGPMRVGDEIRLTATGIYTFEFVSEVNAAIGMSTPPPTGDQPCEVVYRRTEAGYEMEVNGKPRKGLTRQGIKEGEELDFWADKVCAAVSFNDRRRVVINALEVKRAGEAPR